MSLPLGREEVKPSDLAYDKLLLIPGSGRVIGSVSVSERESECVRERTSGRVREIGRE